MLYPLKFKPILKQTIWGGDKLAYKSNDPKVKESIGESWEISGVQDNISVVSEGALEGNSLQELTEIYMGDLVGDKIYEKFGIEFPLLIKYIDARDNLSIQVHPDDATAKARHGFTAWATGHAAMRKSVCWRPRANPSGSRRAYISFLSAP